MYLRMKARQQCQDEFDKAVAVLDAQPDPSKEGPGAKRIRTLAAKVHKQVHRSTRQLQKQSSRDPSAPPWNLEVG